MFIGVYLLYSTHETPPKRIHWYKNWYELHPIPVSCRPNTSPKHLLLVAAPSLNRKTSITVYPNSARKGITVDPYDIEDTSDWLGSPTQLETLKHYAGMLEEDIQAMKLELRAAKENITGLITINDQLAADLQRKTTWITNLSRKLPTS